MNKVNLSPFNSEETEGTRSPIVRHVSSYEKVHYRPAAVLPTGSEIVDN